jgi:putative Holliday junction resolvase
VTRVIGLDHGARRIGVAVGDTETGAAFARSAIKRRSLGSDLAAIGDLVQSEDAELVVIGLPVNMDGSEGPEAAKARAFGAEVGRLGIDVAYVDERLSSWEANERLRRVGRRPRRATGELDSAAARLILQEYLDARVRADRPEEVE